MGVGAGLFLGDGVTDGDIRILAANQRLVVYQFLVDLIASVLGKHVEAGSRLGLHVFLINLELAVIDAVPGDDVVANFLQHIQLEV